VEAFPGRSPTPSGDLDRPQEPGVLHDSVTPDSHLGNKSDIFYYNHENNQLER